MIKEKELTGLLKSEGQMRKQNIDLNNIIQGQIAKIQELQEQVLGSAPKKKMVTKEDPFEESSERNYRMSLEIQRNKSLSNDLRHQKQQIEPPKTEELMSIAQTEHRGMQTDDPDEYELDELKDRVEELKRENNALTLKAQEIRQESNEKIIQLQTQLSDLQNQALENQKETNFAKMEKERLESVVSTYQSEVSSHQIKAQQALSQLNASQQAQEELERSVSRLESKIKYLTEENSQLQGQVGDMRRSKMESQQEIFNLQSNIKQEEMHKKSQADEKNALAKKIEEMLQQKMQMQFKIDNIDTSIK